MLELYIQGKKADLSENTSILLTYKGVELDKPTAQRNTFSKTIELRGTDNNNAIFSDIWRLDSVTNTFNPRQRVPATIYKNGDIVEDGYLKLNDIKRDEDGLVYNTTFYSNLGDFFYGLQYDDNDNPLTLSDIFPNDSITWNAQYVHDAWFPANEESRKLIIPAPVYGGLYEDFDNNKCLIDYSSLTQQERNFIGAATITVDNVEYSPYDGRWVMGELSRDADEWEMNALYAQNLRPSIRLRDIVGAIQKHSAYTITLPEDAIINKYLDNGYVVLGRLTPKEYTYDGADAVEMTVGGASSWITLNGSSTIDNSGGDYNTLALSLSPQINVKVSDINNYPTNVYTVFDKSPNTNYHFYRMTTVCYRVKIENGDNVSYSKVYAVHSQSDGEIPYYLLNDYIVKAFGLNDASEIAHRDITFEAAATSIVGGADVVTYAPSDNLEINIPDIPHSANLRLSLEMKQINITHNRYGDLGRFLPDKDNKTEQTSEFYVELPSGCVFYSFLSGLSDNYDSVLYNGNVSPAIEPQTFKIADILGATKSPYDYLIGLTRLFGLKYVYDIKSKTVQIMRRTDFYNGETVDISELIDYGREINVKPSVAATKYYQCDLDTPKTYASEVYARKANDRQGRPYGALLYNTGYDFNADTTKLFDGTIYQNVIPYRHSSIYFNRQSNISSIFNPKTMNYTYFNTNGSTEERYDFTKYGVSATSPIAKIYDPYKKLCFFDKDDKNVTELTNALVFWDGFDIVSESDAVTVYNAVPEMITLNDNPCHLIIGHGQWTPAGYYFKTNYIPRFSKTFNAEISWDFDRPLITIEQLGGNVNDDYTQNITISKRFWKDYLNDLYHIDGKIIDCYVNLSGIVVGNGEPRDLMRVFYWFGGSVWVLNEIADYDISGENSIVKCQFIKVYDVENYKQTTKNLTEQGATLVPVVNEDTGEIEYEEEAGGKGFDFDEPEPPDYLCFTAQEANSTVGKTGVANVEYSTNGTTWTTMISDTPITLTNVGDKVYLRGNNPDGFARQSNQYSHLKVTGNVAASGNFMSLVDATDFESLTTVPSYCFEWLFAVGGRDLTSIDGLRLPATTLSPHCYGAMFVQTKITSIPSGLLPATVMAESCYGSMFKGCTSLTTVPSDLLPATTLARDCYSYMFEQCSFTTAPILPATVISDYAYDHMFSNCTNLNYVKAMIENLGNASIDAWLSGVAREGTFVKNPDTDASVLAIPAGWTVIDGRV